MTDCPRECVGAGVLLDRKVSAEKVGKDLCGSGGFVTPSSLRIEYVDRLRNAGVKIEVGLV
jgi:hypothetical protein